MKRLRRKPRSIGPWRVSLIFMKLLYIYKTRGKRQLYRLDGGPSSLPSTSLRDQDFHLFSLFLFISPCVFLPFCFSLSLSLYPSFSYDSSRLVNARPRTSIRKKNLQEIYRDAVARGQPFLPRSYINSRCI